jgi:3-oxoacyl-[acyl-carrier-protein] synthase II
MTTAWNQVEPAGDASGRVVVSGLGPVSTVGVGAPAFFDAIIDAFESSGSRSVYRHDLKRLKADDYVKLRTQCVDPASRISVIAAALALDDAGWREHACDPTRIGLVLGTAYGSHETLNDYLRTSSPSPIRFVHTFINTAAGLTSQVFQLRGAHAVLCSGSLAGMQSIRYACHLLKAGKADRIICGGADSATGPLGQQNEPGSTFANRTTLEGAGVLALQQAGHAHRRPHAAIAGFSSASDRSLTSEVFGRAIRSAMRSAGIDAREVSAVVLATTSAHPVPAMQREALERLGIPARKWLDLASFIGDVGAALSGLGVIAGCALLKNVRHGQHVLVVGLDRNQCDVIVLGAKS